jgi:hypothetical protein
MCDNAAHDHPASFADSRLGNPSLIARDMGCSHHLFLGTSNHSESVMAADLDDMTENHRGRFVNAPVRSIGLGDAFVGRLPNVKVQ